MTVLLHYSSFQVGHIISIPIRCRDSELGINTEEVRVQCDGSKWAWYS